MSLLLVGVTCKLCLHIVCYSRVSFTLFHAAGPANFSVVTHYHECTMMETNGDRDRMIDCLSSIFYITIMKSRRRSMHNC